MKEETTKRLRGLGACKVIKGKYLLVALREEMYEWWPASATLVIEGMRIQGTPREIVEEILRIFG